MKKFLSLVLAALMCFSCAMFAAADDAAAEEIAVNPAEAYAIEFLANHGIFKGSSTETFVADAESMIQRYQMALFVSRISTGWVDDDLWEDGSLNSATFKDIDTEPANKYLGALSYANQHGIIKGYTVNTFAPYDGITYQDALTMVVRTLGYDDLSYPWGFIEKAVELGLCEGVDAAYTDELTRGQVALIIYNALFAATRSGGTLAKKIFGVDFGWETIVIVASDKDSFGNNGASKAPYAGYVGFKTVDAAGALSGKTYYVDAKELDLDGHKDDLAIGHAYLALFELVDGNIVRVVDADSLLYKTVKNIGITDDEGEAVGTMPIAAELAGYELTDGYYSNTKKNGTITLNLANELMLFTQKKVSYFKNYNNAIGIKWDTNDIVTIKEVDGKYEVDEVMWRYNATLDRYYRMAVTNENVVYVDWMSDDEFAAWYAETMLAKASYEDIYEYSLNTTEAGRAPYAKLQMFDVDFDGLADRALYKDYEIGTFTNTTLKCAACDASKAAYSVTGLDGENKNICAIADTACAHGTAWITVDEDVVGFVNEDGSYNDGVVVYNYNDKTGELEIVKYITKDGTDADSYIVYGTLDSYSTGKATITIDGVKYPLGYTSMAARGSEYGDVSKDITTRTVVASELDGYYMQYVTATVLDGCVVDIDIVTDGKGDDVIVVLAYAGRTNDGYWAVYGYSTFNTGVAVYKINSFNGWKRGDYEYYPENAYRDSAFMKGALYSIKSYDAATQSYNVYTENYYDIKGKAVKTMMDFDRGYRYLDDDDGTKEAATDKYILIYDDGTIYVWDGVVTDDTWFVDAPMTNINGKYVFFVSNGDQVIGFNRNSHEIGFVYYDGDMGRVLEAAYDSAIGDYYLLGASASTVRVTNLLTGNTETVLSAKNIDLVRGQCYMTVGNTIIEAVETNDVLSAIVKAYQDQNTETATYVLRNYTIEVSEGIGEYSTQCFCYEEEALKQLCNKAVEWIKCQKGTFTDCDLTSYLSCLNIGYYTVEMEDDTPKFVWHQIEFNEELFTCILTYIETLKETACTILTSDELMDWIHQKAIEYGHWKHSDAIGFEWLEGHEPGEVNVPYVMSNTVFSDLELAEKFDLIPAAVNNNHSATDAKLADALIGKKTIIDCRDLHNIKVNPTLAAEDYSVLISYCPDTTDVVIYLIPEGYELKAGSNRVVVEEMQITVAGRGDIITEANIVEELPAVIG